jgi:hypothetical protein
VISIDHTQVRAFAEQLREVPPDLRMSLSRRVRVIAGRVVQTIQGNYSWSTRIPGAVKQRVGFGPRSSGVLVYVDSRLAPHARPLEFPNNRAGFNRHPVYGTETWVDQPIRPSFMPGVRSSQPMAVTEIQDAIDDVFRRL